MGGTIGVRSKLGAGSTFFFIVPMPLSRKTSSNLLANNTSSQITNAAASGASEDKEPLKHEEISVVTSTEGTTDRSRSDYTGPVRVLLVDDMTTNRKMMRRCMQKMGFECYEAANGAEAVEICQTVVFDLIAMDNVCMCADCVTE